MPWRLCCGKVHDTQRNNYTGPSIYGFHIWSDDVMLCAKPMVLAVAGNQAKVVLHSWLLSSLSVACCFGTQLLPRLRHSWCNESGSVEKSTSKTSVCSPYSKSNMNNTCESRRRKRANHNNLSLTSIDSLSLWFDSAVDRTHHFP